MVSDEKKLFSKSLQKSVIANIILLNFAKKTAINKAEFFHFILKN
jgi:hypothetical protein